VLKFTFINPCLLCIRIVYHQSAVTYRLARLQTVVCASQITAKHETIALSAYATVSSIKVYSRNPSYGKRQRTRYLIGLRSFYWRSLQRHDDIKVTPTSTQLLKLQLRPPQQQIFRRLSQYTVSQPEANGHPGKTSPDKNSSWPKIDAQQQPFAP